MAGNLGTEREGRKVCARCARVLYISVYSIGGFEEKVIRDVEV